MPNYPDPEYGPQPERPISDGGTVAIIVGIAFVLYLVIALCMIFEYCFHKQPEPQQCTYCNSDAQPRLSVQGISQCPLHGQRSAQEPLPVYVPRPPSYK